MGRVRTAYPNRFHRGLDRERLRCICLGNRTGNCGAFAKSDSYGESNSDINTYSYSNADSYCHANRYSDGNCNSDCDSHSNCNCNGHCNSDTNSDAYRDGDFHTHSNTNTNATASKPYTNSNSYRNCNTSTDARCSASAKGNQCDDEQLHRELEQRKRCDRLPVRCVHKPFFRQLRTGVPKFGRWQYDQSKRHRANCKHDLLLPVTRLQRQRHKPQLQRRQGKNQSALKSL
jgi:hypothetical protein